MKAPRKVLTKKVGATSHAVVSPKAEPLPSGRLRSFAVGSHLPAPMAIFTELQDMTDVLLGREDPPIHSGVHSLQEVADAYFARASELTMLIQRGERDGTIAKSSAHYRIRTGELRTFMEMAKRAADLGSRRLSAEALLFDQAKYGRTLDYDAND